MNLNHVCIQAITILLLLSSIGCQSTKSALQAIREQEWEKAQATLEKQLANLKDSVHSDVYYAYSILYSDSLYTQYSVDSAYQYILLANTDYKNTSEKEKTKLNRAVSLTDSTLTIQKRRLDSLAFDEAKEASTVSSYQSFLDQYRDASQREDAVRLRNQLAFTAAQQLDTYQAYREFMNTYPEAEQYNQAEERFNTLVFQAQTKTGNLASYYQFLDAFPQSPYRLQAEQAIFSITTASNDLASYANFARDFPNSILTRKAVNWLYHLYREAHSADSFFIAYSNLPFLDSLKQAEEVAAQFLLPYWDQQFGFVNLSGESVITPRFTSVPPAYLCSGIEYSHIFGIESNSLQMIDKNGEILRSLEIESSEIEEIKQLAGGLYWAKLGDSGALLHASGEVVISTEENTKAVELLISPDSSYLFIKYRVGDQWGLKTFTGTTLLSPAYDDIIQEEGFIVLEKDDRLAITNRTTIAEQVSEPAFKPNFLYQDVAPLNQHYLLGFTDEYETVLDTALTTVVPLEKHTVLQQVSLEGEDIFLLRASEKQERIKNDSLITEQVFRYSLYPTPDNSTLPSTFSQAYYNEQWLTLKQNQQYWLLCSDSAQFSPETYDSVKILSEHFVITFPKKRGLNDTATLIIADHHSVQVPLSSTPKETSFRLLRTQGASHTNLVEESVLIRQPDDQTLLLTQSGDTMQLGNVDQVVSYPDRLYVIEKSGKQGVVDQRGNELVPAQYQRIGNYQSDGLLSLFNRKKFGVYHPRTGVIIEPAYESVIQYYSVVIQDSVPTPLYIAQKEGKFGIIDADEQLLLPFEFQAIRYWNDSSALVRYDNLWHIYTLAKSSQRRMSFDEQAIQYGGITEFSELSSISSEKLLRFYKEGDYGILSNQQGEVLPPSFDDIRLLIHPQTQEPIYLTEKYIPEAKLYILIYQNVQGDIIFRKAYEPDAYDKLYCDE